jgi:hypothetical protein
MRQQGSSGWCGVHAGSCHVWPLPADATCAAVARQVFRDAAEELGLEPELLAGRGAGAPPPPPPTTAS